jgi:hypothetical protein
MKEEGTRKEGWAETDPSAILYCHGFAKSIELWSRKTTIVR